MEHGLESPKPLMEFVPSFLQSRALERRARSVGRGERGKRQESLKERGDISHECTSCRSFTSPIGSTSNNWGSPQTPACTDVGVAAVPPLPLCERQNITPDNGLSEKPESLITEINVSAAETRRVSSARGAYSSRAVHRRSATAGEPSAKVSDGLPPSLDPCGGATKSTASSTRSEERQTEDCSVPVEIGEERTPNMAVEGSREEVKGSNQECMFQESCRDASPGDVDSVHPYFLDAGFWCETLGISDDTAATADMEIRKLQRVMRGQMMGGASAAATNDGGDSTTLGRFGPPRRIRENSNRSTSIPLMTRHPSPSNRANIAAKGTEQSKVGLAIGQLAPFSLSGTV
eukprot:GHVU01191318.1.p1 GENE.GHVU01191318.1~~GHVU01191318.1.p1  ORF type:complete len:347 (-),score=25.16 GHVU01191318.1:1182-2222(-)